MLSILQEEKRTKYAGGIYHKTQIDLTYNSNHIEGSRLTHDQTRYIFETNTIGIENEVLNVDDVIETSNHFRCIDLIIDHAASTLSEHLIKNCTIFGKPALAIPVRTGSPLAGISACQMRSVVCRPHFQKKLPIE